MENNSNANKRKKENCTYQNKRRMIVKFQSLLKRNNNFHDLPFSFVQTTTAVERISLIPECSSDRVILSGLENSEIHNKEASKRELHDFNRSTQQTSRNEQSRGATCFLQQHLQDSVIIPYNNGDGLNYGHDDDNDNDLIQSGSDDINVENNNGHVDDDGDSDANDDEDEDDDDDGDSDDNDDEDDDDEDGDNNSDDENEDNIDEHSDNCNRDIDFARKEFLSGKIVGLPLPMVPKANVFQGDHLLALLAIAVRFNYCHNSIMAMLTWINDSYLYNYLPATKDDLWRMLGRNDAVITHHYYCEDCQAYLGKGAGPTSVCSCGKCGPHMRSSKLKYFLQINLFSQLSELFKIPNIDSLLKYRFTKDRKKYINTIEDIYDGDEYRRLSSDGNFLSNRYNFSFTINTDGCQVAKSSQASAWPIFVEINELPPHIRKKHMLLAAIWVDNKHPLLNMYLHPIIEELQLLYENGITWKDSKNITRISKFLVTICTVDSPARSAILRMKQFNGYFGCSFCKAKGEHTNKHIWPMKTNFEAERTDEEILQDMLTAHEQNIVVRGIKGISSLTNLPEFSISKGVVVESMHAVYLGVVKQHTTLMLTLKNGLFYIGKPSTQRKIDRRLLHIMPPSRRARLPRTIKKCKLWKASEWRNWLDYAPVCLEGFVDKRYVEHIALLSQAIHYLNSDALLVSEIIEAEKLLKEYVAKFEEYFGANNMSYNIHLLNHLPRTVRNWGPIWVHSAATFESWNKRIITKVTSPHCRADQIVTRFLMAKFVEGVVSNPDMSKEAKNYISKILNIPDCDNEFLPRIFVNLSKENIRSLTLAEKQCLGYHHLPKKVRSFIKVKIRGIEYRTHNVKVKTKHCNSIIYCEDIGFGRIISIIEIKEGDDKKFGIFMTKYTVLAEYFGTEYIKKVEVSNNTIFINIYKTLIRPAIEIVTPRGLFVMKIPNCWETD